jgi:hypothetical protein
MVFSESIMQPVLKPVARGVFPPSRDPYAVLRVSPEYTADFSTQTYRSGGAPSSLGSMFVRSGGLSTIHDGAALKWCPHNVLRQSARFDLSPWVFGAQGTGVAPTLTPNYALSPDGTMTAYRLQCSRSSAGGADRSRIQQDFASYGPIGSQMTNGIWIRSTDGTPQDIQVQDSTENNSDSTVTVGAEWQLVGREYDILLTTSGNFWVGLLNSGTTALTADVLIWGAHLYRSDLGGMVDNPDRGDSYVPTEASVVYMARSGHHMWDGSAWVDEGLLLEQQARTNLLPHSNATTSGTLVLTTAPSGGTRLDGGSALKLTPNSGASLGSAYFAPGPDQTLTAATDYTFAVDVETAGFDRVALLVGESGTANYLLVTVDLTTGLQVGSTVDAGDFTPIQVTAEQCSATIYRVAFAFTTGALATGTVRCRIYAGDSTATTGDGTSGINISYWQLEAGDTPSSRMPTLGAAFTRPSDTYYSPPSVIPFNTDHVSIQIEGRMTYADRGAAAQVIPYNWTLDGNNYISVEIYAVTSPDRVRFRQAASGVFDVAQDSSGVISQGVFQRFNFAARHGSTFVNGSASDTVLTADTTPTILPDLSASNFILGGVFMGTIKKLRIWGADITDAGIIAARK